MSGINGEGGSNGGGGGDGGGGGNGGGIGLLVINFSVFNISNIMNVRINFRDKDRFKGIEYDIWLMRL